jgi:4-amino-4-deoxy-L-arabinose transferase-like glycosyltransferase
MVIFAVSLVIAYLCGFLLVAYIWGCKDIVQCHTVIKLCLALGIGLGLSSFLSFLLLLLIGHIDRIILITADICLLIASLYFFVLKYNKNKILSLCESFPIKYDDFFSHTLNKIIVCAFIIIFYTAALLFSENVFLRPHGEWDAWAIWNVHARFIFLGGPHWTNVFSPQLLGTHADYPWLLPSLIARFWTYMGNDTVLVPITISTIFTFFTVFLLYASLSLLKGIREGIIAATVLLGTPLFFFYGASQMADIPLSFYFLMTLVLLTFFLKNIKNYQVLLLTGLSMGMALFTKNEGLLFFMLVTLIYFLFSVYIRNKQYSLSNYRYFLFPVVSILSVLIYSKFHFGLTSDLFNENSNQLLFSRLLDFDRYSLVTEAFLFRFIHFGGFQTDIPLAFFMYILVTGSAWEKKNISGIIFIFTLLICMLLGYFMIYIATPHDLSWHLQSSLERLFIQLWPSFIFLIFLTVPSQSEKTSFS